MSRTHARSYPPAFSPMRRGAAPLATPGMVMPYDYAASFRLKGVPGNIVQDIINVSSDGVFVAMAIGYGLQEERGQPLTVNVGDSRKPNEIRLEQIPIEALITGFRLHPRIGSLVAFDQELLPQLRETVLQRLKPAEDISFLFSIVDSASGRELQDEPTHNLASLGKSNGERPFRQLAQPLTFMPRSTVRLQIVERSEGVKGMLFIVLYGYKMLGASDCPEPLMRSLRGSPICPIESIGRPSERVVPFDYVARVELSGRPENLVETEVPINVEGGFVATALGYGLAIEEGDILIEAGSPDGEMAVTLNPPSIPDLKLRNVVSTVEQPLTNGSRELPPGEYEVRLDGQRSQKFRIISGLTTTASINVDRSGVPEVVSATIDLKKLPLRLFPLNALTSGFRIRPSFLRIAFDNSGFLTSGLPVKLVDSIFEPLNRPEDVSFRYSIFDSGAGRDLQNQPIHNVAGLGIANGDRPFKKFARAMIFRPRSVIRVTVQEHFGRGMLYFVFQGYKVLGFSSRGVRR